MAQTVGNLPAMQETQVQSLGWEGSLREEVGNPLQYSCLENPMDRGAWQATVRGVTQSQTQLKGLSSSGIGVMDCVSLYGTQESHSETVKRLEC